MQKRNLFRYWPVVGVIGIAIMFWATLSSHTFVTAATQTDSGSVDVSGVVPGPPPATPPTINYPGQGATFNQKNIEVRGECLPGLVVRIFRNGVFAGSALCQPDARYSLQIDLAEGRNDLVAIQYDSLNQPSPPSDTVTVYFLPQTPLPVIPGPGEPPAPPAPPAIAQFQLFIDYDYTQQSVFVNKPFRLPIRFSGGTPPYAVSIDWGDGTSSIISRENAEQFMNEHVYSKAGYYKVVIRVSDRDGNQGYLQFVVLVNGKPTIVSPDLQNLFGGAVRMALWPVVLMMIVVGIIAFLGGMLFGRSGRRLRNFGRKAKFDKKT